MAEKIIKFEQKKEEMEERVSRRYRTEELKEIIKEYGLKPHHNEECDLFLINSIVKRVYMANPTPYGVEVKKVSNKQTCDLKEISSEIFISELCRRMRGKALEKIASDIREKKSARIDFDMIPYFIRKFSLKTIELIRRGTEDYLSPQIDYIGFKKDSSVFLAKLSPEEFDVNGISVKSMDINSLKKYSQKYKIQEIKMKVPETIKDYILSLRYSKQS